MLKNRYSPTLRHALILAIGGTVFPLSLPAGAQALEEVIVTAQRREQSLQDIPLSITALSGDALDVRLIYDLVDLQFSVPNLLTDGQTIAIRGIGQNSNASTAEGGIGFHINDVYVNSPLINSTEYFDVERVEVLRGPQGTLYGRNTTAGVINIRTVKPHDDFGGFFSATAGNYESLKFKGAINFPLGDRVRQRFAGSYLSRAGYNENIYTGNDIDGRDNYEVRSSTAFDFTDRLSADLVVSYLREDSDRASRTKGTCTKDAVTGCSALSAGFETPDVSRSIFQTINLLFLGGSVLPPGDYFADAYNPPEYRTVNVDQEPTHEAEQLGVSLEFNYEAGDYRFTSLTGYYDTEVDNFADFDRFATDVRTLQPITYRANGKDYVTTDVIHSGRRDVAAAEQFSQEFRVASDFDGWFNFLAGVFYFDEEGSSAVSFTHPTIAAAQQRLGLPLDFEMYNIETDPVTTESIALFGEGYFAVSDHTRLTLGVRYTDDEKSGRTRAQFLTLVEPDWVQNESDWQEFTGKITLEHDIGESSNIFASIARGYKAGGLNAAAPKGFEVFDPEYVDALELGSKNLFNDGRIQANFGVFYYDYAGMQLAQLTETATVTVNGDSTVMGAEAEFVFAPSEAWLFDLNLAWLDLEINNFESADDGDPDGIAPGTIAALDENGDIKYTARGLLIKDLDGNVLRNAPEFSVKVGMEYRRTLFADYDLSARADYFWQDDYYANEFNKPSDKLAGWEQLDLQATLQPLNAGWYVRTFVKNALDNDDVIRLDQQGPTVGRFRSATVLEPRTYGIEFGMLFE